MKNYSTAITNQPQTKPIIGRTDMVKNNAGGYVFQITQKEQLERFLLLGTEGGTYYVKEKELTIQNAQAIIALIKTNGFDVVTTVVDFAKNRKAPRADAGIFVLALCASYGDAPTKQAAYNAISTVCNTATHLFTFLANIKNLRGWSRGLRNGVAKWYLSKSPEKLAYQLVKYRNRNGYTHRDALRLCHASSTNEWMNELFKYAVDKKDGAEVANKLVNLFTAAQKTTTANDLLPLIDDGQLAWEMIPTELLNDEKILKALLPHMPLGALMRNLNRYAYNGLTSGNNETVKAIVAKLTNAEAVEKAGMHPVMVLNSMKTYERGQGEKGNKTWKANQQILDAISEMYELSVKFTKASGKSFLVGCDISGSMNSNVAGMSMEAGTLAQVLAATMLKVEKDVTVVNFDTGIVPYKFGKRTAIGDILKYSTNGGGTDCAAPILYALQNKLKVDAIVILTDNETWAGRTHALDAITKYRKTINADVKIIEIAMTCTGFSNYPNDDKNLLRVVGFDNSVIDLVSRFV